MSAPGDGGGVVGDGDGATDGAADDGTTTGAAAGLSSPEPDLRANVMPPPASSTTTTAPMIHSPTLEFRTAEQ